MPPHVLHYPSHSDTVMLKWFQNNTYFTQVTVNSYQFALFWLAENDVYVVLHWPVMNYKVEVLYFWEQWNLHNTQIWKPFFGYSSHLNMIKYNFDRSSYWKEAGIMEFNYSNSWLYCWMKRRCSHLERKPKSSQSIENLF